MLCEKCKIREANIRYTEVIDGVKTEHNLCSHCVKEMDFGHYAALFDADDPIGKLLSGFFEMEEDTGEDTERAMNRIVCPTCHTAYGDFVKDSRFGCPDCYGVFDLLMNETIKKLQGNDTHIGKNPKEGYTGEKIPKRQELSDSYSSNEEDQDLVKRIEVLSMRLQEAIREEEYEQAAKYRDEIRELREKSDADA